MKKTTLLIVSIASSLFFQNIAFSKDCQAITNPYAETYQTDSARQEIFENNRQYIHQALQHKDIDTIPEAELDQLLNCMRSTVKLGDPQTAIILSNLLMHQATPETVKEAYLTRIIANTHQQYDVMADLKHHFHDLGADAQVLKMHFQDKTADDFAEIFSTESHLAVSDLKDLQMAFNDNWENMPALSNYLMTHSKKGSVGEMLGVIVLQESSVNAVTSHENNLDAHLIIADYVTNHLAYRPSYDFSKAVYEVALTEGNPEQQSHAQSQLQKLQQFKSRKP